MIKQPTPNSFNKPTASNTILLAHYYTTTNYYKQVKSTFPKNIYIILHIHQFKENEMGGAYSIHGR